jgi:mitochondrial enoyl-[acyl-carrier protein] reductase / trans-2-enoyl-CoA reductase
VTWMRQVVHRRCGPPADVVEIDRVDIPTPGPGEVLVELEAAPIHPAELLMFEGRYGYGPSVPPLPRKAGTEGVGRVVGGRLQGTRVALAGVDGVWSDFAVLPEAHAVTLPESVSRDQLAMGVVNPQSALLLLSDFAELRPGDWVVQNAANSAVGRILDAVARRRGVHVVNVVRSTAAAERLTTASPVLVDAPDLPERVAEVTGDGAVLAIDAVGGTATDRLARTLAEGGTVVNYGLLSGEPCVLDPALCVFHGVTLTGFWMPRSLRARTPEERSTLLTAAFDLLAEGAFTVPVERTYPLDEVGEAVEHAGRAGRHGKILLTR